MKKKAEWVRRTIKMEKIGILKGEQGKKGGREWERERERGKQQQQQQWWGDIEEKPRKRNKANYMYWESDDSVCDARLRGIKSLQLFDKITPQGNCKYLEILKIGKYSGRRRVWTTSEVFCHFYDTEYISSLAVIYFSWMISKLIFQKNPADLPISNLTVKWKH